MPRPRRCLLGGMVFHVLNRGVNRRTLFHNAYEFEAFVGDVLETLRTKQMRICSFCLMPNHWHMVLWPERDGEVTSFLHHLASLHALRWKRRHGEVGLGPLYQGRFKAFPVQTDQHFFTVVRYVERNPLRANLVTAAEAWKWSSLGQASSAQRIPVSPWPCGDSQSISQGERISWVNTPQTMAEVESIRQCSQRGAPYGDDHWTNVTAISLGLESTIRKPGRPRARHPA
jgi:putative transposase